MKKLSILFIALALVFSSCSTDDSNSTITDDIVGVWEATNVDAKMVVSTTISGITVETDYDADVYDLDSSLTFTEDPNDMVTEGTFSVKGSVEAGEEPISFDEKNLPLLGNGTWDVVGSELQIETTTGTAVAKIKKLTESELVLLIEEDIDLPLETLELTEGISEITTTIEIESTYTR